MPFPAGHFSKALFTLRTIHEMLMRRKLLQISIIMLFAAVGYRSAFGVQLLDGDIIFQTSMSAQSIAIQKATHSKYSHMGIIFFQAGSPYVYEAFKTVRYTPLKKWIARGKGGHYVVKRLRTADRILTPGAVQKLIQAAKTYEGKPYDLTFEWSDDRIYCSELVWKIYYNGLRVQIGRLQKLRDFDLSEPHVKAKIQERYGNNIPLGETVVSPESMFSSDALVVVLRR
jgi:hypothetical protein